jgi:phytanoyl-CoA dioxygenase PhyH
VNENSTRQPGVAGERDSDPSAESIGEKREATIPTFSVPVSEEDFERLRHAFFREGCVIITGLFSPEETAVLRAKTDSYAADPSTPAKHISYAGNTLVLRRCHEMDPLFDSLITKAAICRIAEAVLGPDAKFNAMNVIRNETGQAISRWHVDDVVEFPLPPSIPRFDERMQMPVLWMTIQIALTDIDSVENGATQFVPGSHYSGRSPSGENPRFEGQGPKAVLCKAGDAYLTNHQCWHRGAPNLSERTRYLMQLQFAQRWADKRFRGLA